jgi:hypothetical protein
MTSSLKPSFCIIRDKIRWESVKKPIHSVSYDHLDVGHMRYGDFTPSW